MFRAEGRSDPVERDRFETRMKPLKGKADHMKMKICGISFISNLASGISETPLSHEEVKAAGDAVAPKFQALVKLAISKM